MTNDVQLHSAGAASDATRAAPAQVVAAIRDRYERGATMDTLASAFALPRAVVCHVVRRLAKQRPFSDDDVARFWQKVDQGDADACWLWLGGRSYGCGQFVAAGTALLVCLVIIATI